MTLGSVLAPSLPSLVFCLAVESLGYGGIEYRSDDSQVRHPTFWRFDAQIASFSNHI